MRPQRLLTIAFVAIFAAAAAASAAPSTPAPTGAWADEPKAIEGKLGETLANGVLRFKLLEVRDARPEDHPETVVPLAGQKVMVLAARLHNTSPTAFAELLTYTLDRNDAESFLIPGHFLTPISLQIKPGATVKQTALFPVDATLAPTSLLFQCASCGKAFKPFRVTLPASTP
jgi:hypothetical protein